MMPPVGASARRTRTVRAEDIELFTQITGDHNPLHYDARRRPAADSAASSSRVE
jgi:acyl dehydratase